MQKYRDKENSCSQGMKLYLGDTQTSLNGQKRGSRYSHFHTYELELKKPFISPNFLIGNF